MLNKKVFSEGMTLLAEIFSKELSKLLLKAYYEALKDLSDEQFQKAIQLYIKTSKYNKFPIPANLREMITISNEDKAYIALEKVEKAVDRYGHNYSIVFDDPIIHAVIHRLGGWIWLTTQKYEEWKWIRKDFIKYYNLYSQMDSRYLDIPERLSGNCELINYANGYDEEVWQKMIIYVKDNKMIENKEKKLIEK